MTLQKIKYNTGINIVEIKIKDETGRFIENWTLMMSDLYKWVDIMKRKYGLEFKKIERDLEWIR